MQPDSVDDQIGYLLSLPASFHGHLHGEALCRKGCLLYIHRHAPVLRHLSRIRYIPKSWWNHLQLDGLGDIHANHGRLSTINHAHHCLTGHVYKLQEKYGYECPKRESKVIKPA